MGMVIWRWAWDSALGWKPSRLRWQRVAGGDHGVGAEVGDGRCVFGDHGDGIFFVDGENGEAAAAGLAFEVDQVCAEGFNDGFEGGLAFGVFLEIEGFTGAHDVAAVEGGQPHFVQGKG